ncbi:hypothetical protein BaRGS_00013441 [Batillaria attramentaria]|uniref:Uncharacterized protein n=1 Tax=Batillaria attramentaria TaxID=370345 RepID=A0ABD0L7E0_9CAEN
MNSPWILSCFCKHQCLTSVATSKRSEAPQKMTSSEATTDSQTSIHTALCDQGGTAVTQKVPRRTKWSVATSLWVITTANLPPMAGNKTIAAHLAPRTTNRGPPSETPRRRLYANHPGTLVCK